MPILVLVLGAVLFVWFLSRHAIARSIARRFFAGRLSLRGARVLLASTLAVPILIVVALVVVRSPLLAGIVLFVGLAYGVIVFAASGRLEASLAALARRRRRR